MKHLTSCKWFFFWLVLPACVAIGMTGVAVAQCQSSGSTCFINSNCCSGMCAQPAPGCHTELCPTAVCVGNSSTINLKTLNGHYLTAVNGGGVGGPNTGPESAAIHTDPTTIGPWETFTCQIMLPSSITFQTKNGDFVTAVNGGGIGGPNANPWQLHTDATNPGPWEQYTFVNIDNTHCALKTNNGDYVSAVNGGGWGNSDTANKYPIHTNATSAGPWETFTIVSH